MMRKSVTDRKISPTATAFLYIKGDVNKYNCKESAKTRWHSLIIVLTSRDSSLFIGIVRYLKRRGVASRDFEARRRRAKRLHYDGGHAVLDFVTLWVANRRWCLGVTYGSIFFRNASI